MKIDVGAFKVGVPRQEGKNKRKRREKRRWQRNEKKGGRRRSTAHKGEVGETALPTGERGKQAAPKRRRETPRGSRSQHHTRGESSTTPMKVQRRSTTQSSTTLKGEGESNSTAERESKAAAPRGGGGPAAPLKRSEHAKQGAGTEQYHPTESTRRDEKATPLNKGKQHPKEEWECNPSPEQHHPKGEREECSTSQKEEGGPPLYVNLPYFTFF